ncbi:unnamed protein product [Thelazia callipaeda]|uniref:Cytochrome b5 heme-binding domain-containing protein n=1 Tax=Thelazia callipaeda TaxID=103827 RepID=A0A0N5CMW4_THECL|nr:unnamed protein product [Thelazia callipaeda]
MQIWSAVLDGYDSSVNHLKSEVSNEWRSRNDRSLSSTGRIYYPRQQLQTSALVYCALQVAFISFLFSYYGISTGHIVRPVLSWTLRNFQKLHLANGLFNKLRELVSYVQSSIVGGSTSEHNPKTTISPTKKNKARQKVDIQHIAFLEKIDSTLPVFTKAQAICYSSLILISLWKTLSREQLSFFDGTRPSKGTYLAILGRIYDVQKGVKHYGPGGSYHFFSGRDATRAFVSGDFSEKGLVDDIDGFDYQDLLGIFDWIKFYEKDYDLVGYLQGTYYDVYGQPTSRLLDVIKLIERALIWKDNQAEDMKIFPPCNSDWHKETGGRVWCSTKSGGVERSWAGVPRKLFDLGSKSYRCACVRNFGDPLSNFPGVNRNSGYGDLQNPNLKEYEGCKPTSNACRVDNSS